MIEEIFFTRNPENQRIVGIINHGKFKKSTSALILAHGFKGYKEQRYLEYLARRLGEKFVVLRFDFTNGIGESDGDIFDITVGHYVEDLKTVIRFVKNELYYVDKDKISLCGHSLGGLVSALVASRDLSISGLILMAAPFDLRIIENIPDLKTPFNQWQEKGFAIFRSEGKNKDLKVGYEFYREGASYDIEKITKRIKCPALILHGSKDINVPLEHSEKYLKNLSGDKKLVIIEGAPHTFKEEAHLKQAKEEIRKWLKEFNDGAFN